MEKSVDSRTWRRIERLSAAAARLFSVMVTSCGSVLTVNDGRATGVLDVSTRTLPPANRVLMAKLPGAPYAVLATTAKECAECAGDCEIDRGGGLPIYLSI